MQEQDNATVELTPGVETNGDTVQSYSRDDLLKMMGQLRLFHPDGRRRSKHAGARTQRAKAKRKKK